MSRPNKTGRSKGGGKFLQLHEWMMESAAWRSLSPQDRAVFIEVARLYNGANNGFLGLGVRAASVGANVNKDTAAKAFARLIERGFLEPARLGAFNRNARQATEWRLTAYKCDKTGALPSKSFMRWRPEDLERRPKSGTPKSETRGHERGERPASVPRFRTIEGGARVA